MPATSPTSCARALWLRVEAVHAVTYFAEESIAAAKDEGLKGFWMGYFGFRAAPMGAVGPGVVTAVFANFAPSMVERAIPDAWTFADPRRLVAARRRAAAAALRRLDPDLDSVAAGVLEPLERIVAAASPCGRPLFAANAEVPLSEDRVERLWQLATCLREHRGDGHVHALSLAEVDGCEAHVLHAAESGVPTDVLRANRGWSETEWSDAADRLGRRGLLAGGELTAAGRDLRRRVEAETDRLAARPIAEALDGAEREILLAALTPPARLIGDSSVIPFPNPMGLPRIAR